MLAVPVVAVVVAALARRVGVSGPLALVIAGVLAALVPGVPQFRLDPEFALFIFLPPLLFSAAWQSSWFSMRENVWPIASLSVGLVLFTAAAVGYAVHAVVPGLSLAAAFVLGAIVAPPDAVAAVSVAQRLGLPRRMVSVLVGESLFNDATALTAFRIAVAAATGEGVSLIVGTEKFLLATLGGVVVGLALGPPLHWLRSRLNDPLVEVAVLCLAPFAAYLIAESFHASGVIAVVLSGLYLGHRSDESPARARLLGGSFWRVLVFILESVVFLLIGLQLPVVLDALSDNGYGWGELTQWAVVVFLITVAARFVWVFVTGLAPNLLFRKDRLPWREGVVLSWAGMRGVVSLAAAFAIPVDADGRDLVLFLTFTTVLATLLIQGFTFPALIKRLGIVSDQERYEDVLNEANVQHKAANAALKRLEELGADTPHEDVVERLRQLAEHRRDRAWERLGGGVGRGGAEVPTATYYRLRLEMLHAERAVFVEMRNARKIDKEVVDMVLHELDLEEAMLGRD